HRDVKPSNIMLAHDGRVVLGDFGLAMDVQQGSLGEVVGTPHYIAPEQARHSADAVPQSDLYSLGVILYEMLTGAVPFDDPSPTTLALQHLTLEPPAPRNVNPALNVETETVLLKALSKSPKDRYQTGKDLIGALERALLISIPNPAAKLSLPPPPVAAPKAPRRPSRLSITDRLAPPGAKPHAVEPAPAPRKQTAWLPLVAIIGALAVLGLALVALGIGLADRAESVTTPTATNDQAAITTPTAGSIVSSSTAILVGVGTATAQPEPSHTPPPAPESPTLAVSPTVLYPDGRKFVVFYNDNSFYLLNASDSNSAVTPLAFERLNASGQPLNRFDGWRWAEYYPTINPDRCMSLEIINSQPVLRPQECNELYNSVRTPDRSDNYVFWTTQEGANEFRVLWNDEEIARCQIADGRCEFFLP
ncbi:MAG TPA: protein kinase, partial [Anaerolineales bacterium]|nr:protein kinase [Anaerolineales bacterium]